MNREDLIAPLQYNLVMEIEKYTKDESKVAVKWEDQEGETKEDYLSIFNACCQ